VAVGQAVSWISQQYQTPGNRLKADPSAPLGISAAGSRCAHARETPQVNME